MNFLETAEFLQRLSRTTEENGPGVERLAARLRNVQPEVRSEFAEIALKVHQLANQQRQRVHAENPASPSTQSRAVEVEDGGRSFIRPASVYISRYPPATPGSLK